MVRGYDKFNIFKNLLLNLKFDEGQGLVTHDYAKPNHEGATLNGAPTFEQLASGKNVLDFDSGNPDFIEIDSADTVDLDFTTEDFTIGMWVNPALINADRFFICRGDDGNDGWGCGIFGNTGRLVMRTYNGATRREVKSPANTLAINSWQFVVFVRDSTTGKVYLNGVDVVESTDSITDSATSARKLLIGIEDDETTKIFDGKIGEVWIWERAIEADEVKQLYEITRGDYE